MTMKTNDTTARACSPRAPTRLTEKQDFVTNMKNLLIPIPVTLVLVLLGILLGILATAEVAWAGLTNPAGIATVTTQSIEVNGKSYAPGSTVTLTNPTITWRVVIANDQLPKAGTPGHIAYYASLCKDTTCVLDGSGQFPAWNESASAQTNNLTQATVTNGVYQAYYGDTANSFFSYPAHAQQINAQSLGLTFVVITPAAYSLASNGTAISTINAKGGTQALVGTITPKSDDVGAAGQLYLAALLPDGSLYFKAASGWVQWKTGTLPVYSTVTALAASNPVDIGSYDLAGLTGATIYVGYGKGTGAAAEADLITGKFLGWSIK